MRILNVAQSVLSLHIEIKYQFYYVKRAVSSALIDKGEIPLAVVL
jgi:hypothetical protein